MYIIYAQTSTHTYISVDDRALEWICQPAIPVRDAKPTGKNFCCRMRAGWQVNNLGGLGYMPGGAARGVLVCVWWSMLHSCREGRTEEEGSSTGGRGGVSRNCSDVCCLLPRQNLQKVGAGSARSWPAGQEVSVDT